MSGRILVVDDEPNILVSFAALLKDEGHRPETVDSAEKAERKLQRETFDLILLDLQLPGQSGLDFLRKLRLETLKNDLSSVNGLVPFEVADYLLNKKRKEILDLEIRRDRNARTETCTNPGRA